MNTTSGTPSSENSQLKGSGQTGAFDKASEAPVGSNPPGKVWGSRFDDAPTLDIEMFTASIDIDRRLAPYDVELSKAHATMLAKVGLLTEDEKTSLCNALDKALVLIRSDKFPWTVSLEDIHSHLEAFLIEELGDTGRKIHTARSRNDQVATAFRLWCRDHLGQLTTSLRQLQKSLLGAAIKHQDMTMPAYSHWQRAQPMVASHHFLAHIERLDRDISRCQDATRRLNVMPLGSAAAVGTKLPIDRQMTAELLDFQAPSRNSLDATCDRDFVLEMAFILATIAQHLSSMAEEWIIWNTVEFGFLRIPDRFCTGSSIMPQKKNPDVLELIRGRTARAVGALMQVMTLVKALPLGYQRDLQEDKEPLFQSYDSVSLCLKMMADLVIDMQLKSTNIAQTLSEGFLDATSHMEYLIAHGRPMRLAHEKVGLLVKEAEKRGVPLDQLPNNVKGSIDPLFLPTDDSPGIRNDSLRRAVELPSFGSGSRASVVHQIEYWKNIIDPSSI